MVEDTGNGKYMLTAPTPLKFEDDVLRREDGTPFFENI